MGVVAHVCTRGLVGVSVDMERLVLSLGRCFAGGVAPLPLSTQKQSCDVKQILKQILSHLKMIVIEFCIRRIQHGRQSGSSGLRMWDALLLELCLAFGDVDLNQKQTPTLWESVCLDEVST